MNNISGVFHNMDVRQLIFEIKASNKWKEVWVARNSVREKSKRIKIRRHNVEDQLHLCANPYNWRETAIVLGLYWMLVTEN